jgi:hypothetical protein
MNLRSEKVLKACLSQRSEEEKIALERFIPDEERLLLQELPPFDSQPNKSTSDIHWTWFLPILKEESREMQNLYLSSLPSHDASRLTESLGLEKAPPKASKIAAEFLYAQLHKNLCEAEVLPSNFLPSSPMNALIQLSKKDLLRLINFLGLFDFAFEFRQIIETKNLKRIYSFLTDELREVLGKISPPKDIKPLPGLGLARWNGTAEELLPMLHRRGLAKLGVALSPDDPDLKWILCHKLDTGRGVSVMKYAGHEQIPNAEMARGQIVELLNHL